MEDLAWYRSRGKIGGVLESNYQKSTEEMPPTYFESLGKALNFAKREFPHLKFRGNSTQTISVLIARIH